MSAKPTVLGRFLFVKFYVMQARKLKALLNNTGYAVHQTGGKICIGSPMCSQLLTIDPQSGQIKYALDTFNDGKKAIKNEELDFIWDKLLELHQSGELAQIYDNNDEIPNGIKVYSFDDEKIVESFVDVLGWPNVTHDGTLMYDGEYHTIKEDAIKYGIKETEYRKEAYLERMERLNKELGECEKIFKGCESVIESLSKLLKP